MTAIAAQRPVKSVAGILYLRAFLRRAYNNLHWCFIGVILFPLMVICLKWLDPQPDTWAHLRQTVLYSLFENTAVLVVGVSVITGLLGVSLGWLTAMCEFPGRRWLDWALILPLAVPTYVLAFVFLGIFDFSGPVQRWVDTLLGGSFPLPNVRNAAGLIWVMGFSLYPYVYMLSRLAFISQGRQLIEAAQTLGVSPERAFWKVAIPMALPAILSGMMLALMEALADFGAVSVFNFDTFTTAIYKSWFGLFNLSAAAQLSTLLLVIVLFLLILKYKTTARQRYHVTKTKAYRYQLKGKRAWLASGYAGLVFISAFAVPVLQLAVWALEAYTDYGAGRLGGVFMHTVVLGLSGGIITVLVALALNVLIRHKGNTNQLTTQLATMGYALPGTLLAVGIMISVQWADDSIHWFANLFGFSIDGPIFMGTIAALLYAYMVRFLAVANGPVNTALSRIKPSMIEAAKTLKASNREIIGRIFIPLMRPGLFTAAIMVLIDIMKEMPATLLLRPFGWDTLSVRIYELTSEGEWERAAMPAIVLVIVGIWPTLMLVRKTSE